MQLTGPEVASLPLQSIVTGFLYQPFWSGKRAGAAATPVGASASILISLVVALTVPVAFEAEQERQEYLAGLFCETLRLCAFA